MNLIFDEKLNGDFLSTISESFRVFIEEANGSSRSTKKLIPLHGFIAKTIADRLGPDYVVFSKGWGKGKEKKICGRYHDKMVDIGIAKDGKMVCGIAVKFVMQNYSQNSVNYFEGMLGETANIRSENCPYFQILIVLDELPYFERDYPKKITKWESFSVHNAAKYYKLSNDDVSYFFHSPDKTLIYVVHILPEAKDVEGVKNHSEYVNFYKAKEKTVVLSDNLYEPFGNGVILNDYKSFVDKVYHTIMSK